MSAETIKVLIQIEAVAGQDAPSAADLQSRIDIKGLAIDPDYTPVPGQSEAGKPVLVFRGTVPSGKLAALKNTPGVAGVWTDARVEHFGGTFGMA